MLLVSDRVWVSPGQWGSVALFAFLMACAGGLVVNRAARSGRHARVPGDWVLLVAGRSWWLGEPDGHPAASLAERRAAAVRVLHDLGPAKQHPTRAPGGSSSRRWWRRAPGTCSSGCSARTACSGRSPRAPVSCRSSTDGCPGPRMPGPCRHVASAKGCLPCVVVLVAALLVLALQPWLADTAARVLRLLRREGGHRASSTARRRSCWCATAIAPCSPWPTTSRASPKEFAVVIPVPTFIRREQIHVAEKALIDHLDAYTRAAAGRVLRRGPVPAVRASFTRLAGAAGAPAAKMADASDRRARSLGVTIEAKYTRRRIRHPDPVREGEQRPRDVADARTATGFRPARRTCSAATSARTCASSSRA